MLVISRKLGQQIKIGDNITLTIVKTQGKTVRVGIDAPREVRVIRAELPPLETEPSQHDVRQTKLSDPPSQRPIRIVSDSTSLASPADRTQRRTEPSPTRLAKSHHPHRWSVANMRDRVQSSPVSATAQGTLR